MSELRYIHARLTSQWRIGYDAVCALFGMSPDLRAGTIELRRWTPQGMSYEGLILV